MKQLLFIAGINGSAGLFTPVRRELESRGWTVLVFEHCDESKRAQWNSIEALAEQALAVMDDAAVSSAVVFGESFGGAIAQVFARRWPHRVQRLVLIGAFAYLPFETRRRNLSIIYPILAFVSLFIPRAAFRFSKRFYNPSLSRSEPDALRQAVLNGHFASLSCYVYKAKLAVLFDSRDWLSEVSVPSLVVAATSDQLIPVSCSRQIAALLPNVKYVELPQGGHLAHYGYPDRFLPELFQFLDATVTDSPLENSH